MFISLFVFHFTVSWLPLLLCHSHKGPAASDQNDLNSFLRCASVVLSAGFISEDIRPGDSGEFRVFQFSPKLGLHIFRVVHAGSDCFKIVFKLEHCGNFIVRAISTRGVIEFDAQQRQWRETTYEERCWTRNFMHEKRRLTELLRSESEFTVSDWQSPGHRQSFSSSDTSAYRNSDSFAFSRFDGFEVGFLHISPHAEEMSAELMTRIFDRQQIVSRNGTESKEETWSRLCRHFLFASHSVAGASPVYMFEIVGFTPSGMGWADILREGWHVGIAFRLRVLQQLVRAVVAMGRRRVGNCDVGGANIRLHWNHPRPINICAPVLVELIDTDYVPICSTHKFNLEDLLKIAKDHVYWAENHAAHILSKLASINSGFGIGVGSIAKIVVSQRGVQNEVDSSELGTTKSSALSSFNATLYNSLVQHRLQDGDLAIFGLSESIEIDPGLVTEARFLPLLYNSYILFTAVHRFILRIRHAKRRDQSWELASSMSKIVLKFLVALMKNHRSTGDLGLCR